MCGDYLPESLYFRTFAKIYVKKKAMNRKKYIINILTYLLFLTPLSASAQKITLGSATTKDGGQYQGEMMQGKPHGKGREGHL